MKDLIPAVSRAELKSELNKNTFVRATNNGNNEIYIITHSDSPFVMQEIGRLRELTFRAAGGGTGKEIDIDEFDISEYPYKQLIVWNPTEEEIVGGYRYIECKDAPIVNGIVQLATTELFSFSEGFMKNYLPYTIELGRSFVQPKFQPSLDNRKGLFSLDNLWDGLGAIVVDNPNIKYFFGKVTMYTDFNVKARDLILYFMQYYFPDNENLVKPIHEVKMQQLKEEVFALFHGHEYKEGHKILNQQVRALGENIPPLVNAYMNLSLTMKSFGTAINEHFGGVEETGILVTISDIYESKKDRHINTYVPKSR